MKGVRHDPQTTAQLGSLGGRDPDLDGSSTRRLAHRRSGSPGVCGLWLDHNMQISFLPGSWWNSQTE